MGVRLVLDDFGTGYSSLSYLKHLPLDTIKIDRTFVAGLDGAADRSIVDAVIGLAHGLRISVVAEGIETEAQFETLRAMGCDVGQGYLFASPCRPPTRPGCCDRADPPRRPARRSGRSRAEAVAAGRATAGHARTHSTGQWPAAPATAGVERFRGAPPG